MKTQPERKPEPDSAAPARRALDHLLDEYKRVRSEKESAEIRLARFADTIKGLAALLPTNEREEFARRLKELAVGIEHRGGEIFGNVIELFARYPARQWTVPEVQDALAEKGTLADAKTISNVVNYLAQTGRLRRVARGHYRMLDVGAGLVDAMEINEDGTQRVTEHDN